MLNEPIGTNGKRLRVAVVGGGISGIAMGVKLLEQGHEFTIFEKGSDVGGTWYWARFPGLTCDVPSLTYCFASDPSTDYSRMFATRDEIFAYHRQFVERHGLLPHIRFNREITEMTWEGDAWRLMSSAGEEGRFDAVAACTGILHHPKVPDIPGLESFNGPVMHSARWDRSVATAGKRVAVIGSGSTGVQMVAALAETSEHVVAMQRTPQWMLPAPNLRLGPRLKRVLQRFPRIQPRVINIMQTTIVDHFVADAHLHDGWRRRLIALAARAHLRLAVKEPELRAQLTPTEEILCRRIIISSTFYPAIQRPNVELVRTGIDRIEPNGIVTTDGRLHEVDIIGFATGYHSHNYMLPMRIVGEDGVEICEVWATETRNYRTVGIPGFPNLFMLAGPNIPIAQEYLHNTAERQAAYVCTALDVLNRRDVTYLVPTAEATDRWERSVREAVPTTVWSTGCNSWYLGASGLPVVFPFSRREWVRMMERIQLADYRVGVNELASARIEVG